MKSPVYRWKVSHPAYGAVEVTGPRKYEAVISAARKWAARWTQIARECTFERLEEVAAEWTSQRRRRPNSRHRATIAGACIKNTALSYALADRPVIGGSRRGT